MRQMESYEEVKSMRIIEMEQLLRYFLDFIDREEIAFISISKKTPMEHIADYDLLISKFLEEREARRMTRRGILTAHAEKVTK